MIPKKIHYCWFGNKPKGKKELKCIASWKKYCPDYEIIEWSEANVDLDMMPFVKQAYNAKKYAFVSDVIRLWAILTYGGIYFDTDVELIKSFEAFLDFRGFIGFETNNYVNTGQCFGAEKNNQIIQEMLNCYKKLNFMNIGGTEQVIKCTEINTKILVKHGLICNGKFQMIDGFVVFPVEYFNPYDDPTGRLYITKNTHSIHWYSKSWMSKRTVLRSKLTKPLHRVQRLIRGKHE